METIWDLFGGKYGDCIVVEQCPNWFLFSTNINYLRDLLLIMSQLKDKINSDISIPK